MKASARSRAAPRATASLRGSSVFAVVAMAIALLSVGLFSTKYLGRSKGHAHSHSDAERPFDSQASSGVPLDDPRRLRIAVPDTPSHTAAPTPSRTPPNTPSRSVAETPTSSSAATPSGSSAATPSSSVAGTPPPSKSAAASAAAPSAAPKRARVNWSLDAHPNKYLMVVQAQEGFGAWNDVLFEFLDLARQLNRTLVEPCVRNGCLEPCRCGAIKMVDVDASNLESAFADNKDPLDLPYIDYVCEPYTGHHRAQVGWSYPLRAYADIGALMELGGWNHMVGYDDWCQKVMTPDKSVEVNAVDKRWMIKSGGYCGELHDHWCDQGTKTQGDFLFMKKEFGRPANVQEMVTTLKALNEHTIMYYGYYRGYFGDRVFRNMPFNIGHHFAVKRFSEQHFGKGNPLLVFHWRSEHVDEDMLVPCAKSLTALLDKFKYPDHPTPYRALLMSDMPAPNNDHIIWHTYVGSNVGGRHGAMAVMIKDAKLLKYDVSHNHTDTGVLMIRDFLFGVYADQYITCQGDFHEDCLGCFRSNSNFVARIMQTRQHLGRQSIDKWWRIGQHDLPTKPDARFTTLESMKAGKGLT